MYISPTPLTNRLSNQASMKTSQTGIGPKIACGPVSHTLGLEHHAKACLELHQAVTMGAFLVQPRNEYAVIAQMRKKDIGSNLMEGPRNTSPPPDIFSGCVPG